MRTTMIALAALLSLAILSPPAHAAGANPLEALSLSVGVAERWLNGGGYEDTRDFEVMGNAAFGVTNHLDIAGGVAWGIEGAYVRGYVDARIVATDANDPKFNLWVGVGRYFSDEPSDGLDEFAAKAGLGWAPFSVPLVLGVTAGVGLDTERRTVSASASWPIKITSGGK